jgi:hypothetical protein
MFRKFWKPQPKKTRHFGDPNPEALQDLYEACLNARGAYEALKMFDDDKYLPGYKGCVERLEAAIAKARSK